MPQRGMPSSPIAPPTQKGGLEDLGAIPVPTAPRGQRGGPSSPAVTQQLSLDDLGAKRVGLAAPEPMPEARTLGGFISNIGTSTSNLVTNFYDMFRHPEQTADAMGNVAQGAMQNLSEWLPEGVQNVLAAANPQILKMKMGGPSRLNLQTGEVESEADHHNPVDAVVEAMKHRYGGWENLKRTAYEDPAGLAIDIAGLMGGVGEGITGAGRLAGMTDVMRAGRTLTRASKYVDPIRGATRLGGYAGKYIAKPMVGMAGQLASEGLGLTTGAGGEAIREAFRSGGTEAFNAAMRGEIGIRDIAKQVRTAIEDVKQMRGNEYRARLSMLPQMEHDMRPIMQDMVQELQNFRVDIGIRNGVPTLDFARSTIPKGAARMEMKQVFNDVTRWARDNATTIDRVPTADMDALKQLIGKYYHESSDARKLVTNVKRSIRDELSNVPGYDAMTGRYEAASKFLEEVVPELSAGKKTSLGTTVRKLNNALNQNNDYRQLLIEALGDATHRTLKQQLAGVALSKWAPRGLMRTVTGANVLYAMGHGIHPAALLELLAASPRAVGETVSAAGVARDFYKTAARMSRLPPNMRRFASAPVTRPGLVRPSQILTRPEQYSGASDEPTPPPSVGNR